MNNMLSDNIIVYCPKCQAFETDEKKFGEWGESQTGTLSPEAKRKIISFIKKMNKGEFDSREWSIWYRSCPKCKDNKVN